MSANLMKRVLVIDDDPVVGKCFDHVLSPKGYAVITAAGGLEALDRIAHEDYDAVYTDIKMPGMSGIEVARRIRATRPWLPVVIVTGYGTEEQQAEAKKLGVIDFLHKPLTPEEIEGSAASLMEGEPDAAQAALALPLDLDLQEAFLKTPAARPSAVLMHARNVALFFLAPLIALAYVVIGPLVGLGMLAWMGFKALAKPARR
jgi:CheY-like chemotaxis protein